MGGLNWEMKWKKRRIELGYTQSTIANILGIARSSYTNIELGTKNPSLGIAIKIKEALDTKDDSIFLAKNDSNRI